MDDPKVVQDPSQTGDPSGTPAVTSKGPQTFTKETEAKAISDALSAAGRDAKSITDKTAEAEQILEKAKKVETGLRTEQEQWQKDRDEAARDAVKDDPDALKSLETKQRQRDEKAKLDDRGRVLKEGEDKHTSKVATDIETIRIFNRTKLASEVSVAKGVNVDSLLELAKEDTRESMEATADLLIKAKVTTPLKTVTGKVMGGGDWRDLSPADKVLKGLAE